MKSMRAWWILVLVGILMLPVLTPARAAGADEWSVTYATESPLCESAAVLGDRLFAVLGGTIWHTQDGIWWSMVEDARIAPDEYSYPYAYNLVRCEDVVFALGWDEPMATRDGETWHALQCGGAPIEDSIYRFLYFADRYLCLGVTNQGETLNLYSSPDGLQWEKGISIDLADDFGIWADQIVKFQGALLIPLNKNELIATEDGREFSLRSIVEDPGIMEFSGLTAYEEDNTAFLVAYYHQFGSEDTVRSRLYVTNDAETWRILEADGERVEGDLCYYYASGEKVMLSADDKEYAVLDNAVPDVPVTLGELSAEWFTQARSFAFGQEENFVEYSSGSITFQGMRFELGSGELLRRENERYVHVMGRVRQLKELASDGTGRAIASGSSGLLLTIDREKDALVMTTNFFHPDGSGIKMLDHQNGLFWLCTYSGALYASEDGQHFTGMAALPAAASAIIWDGAMYYLAADDGVYRSADGETWEIVHATDAALRDIAVAEGQYAACGVRGQILCSEDGETWTTDAQELTTMTLYAIAHGNGAWIAGGGSGWGGSGVFVGKFDGGEWELLSDGEEGYTPGENGDWLYENCTYSLKYIDGMFHAVGLNRISDGFHMVSTDGRTWNVQRTAWGKDIARLDEDFLITANSGSSIALLAQGESRRTVDQTMNDEMNLLTPENPIEPLFHATEPVLTSEVK